MVRRVRREQPREATEALGVRSVIGRRVCRTSCRVGQPQTRSPNPADADAAREAARTCAFMIQLPGRAPTRAPTSALERNRRVVSERQACHAGFDQPNRFATSPICSILRNPDQYPAAWTVPPLQLAPGSSLPPGLRSHHMPPSSAADRARLPSRSRSDPFGGLGKSLTGIGKAHTSRRPRLLSMAPAAFRLVGGRQEARLSAGRRSHEQGRHQPTATRVPRNVRLRCCRAQ